MRVRTNIYLEERQARELRQRGLDEGRTMADVVREAIDLYLRRTEARARAQTVSLASLPTGGYPTTPEGWKRRPYFLHDAPLTWAAYVQMLHSPDDFERRWALTRLLDSARWDDVWRLVTMDDIRLDIRELRFRGRDFWEQLSLGAA